MSPQRFASDYAPSEWRARVAEKNARIARSPHFVYRAFDEFGILLYIGCTLNVKNRMGSHADKPWRPFMARLVVSDAYPNLADGRRAEAEAIASERAVFNATQDDNNRTLENSRAAFRHLAAAGIKYPSRHYNDDQSRETHRVEVAAYRALHASLRAELKAGDFPYLTNEDRLENYLAARSAAECAA